jgi:hypothetical protein
MDKHDFSALNDIPGLRFIPCKDTKQPIPKNWQTQTTPHDLTQCVYVGLVCGEPSGGIEVIDVDEKYSLDGKLFENYKKAIHQTDPMLLKKLVVQKTKNGGFHFIYRCAVIGGNSKLANRPTTDREKKETYDKAFQAELVNPKNDKGEEQAKKVAEKAYKNDKVRVLLETRGTGGQIIIHPSPGYEIIHGDIYGINQITLEEREILFSVARSFNKVFVEKEQPKQIGVKREGLSTFDDYNERGDVVGLLESNGWKFVGTKSDKTIFLRPGQTTSQTSGNYDHAKKWFSVFTTSTEFEPETAYLPYAVYAMLECNGNFSEASKKLYDLGYGDRYEEKKKNTYESTRVIKSRVDPLDDDYSFLATGDDYNGYLGQVIDGTLPMGLTTGSPEMDKHFLFKEAELMMFNGHDNVGKSVFVWWLLMLSAMYHGWVGIIFSSENTLGAFMRKMIQFYWGKPLRGFGAQTPQEFETAKAFVEKHFILIKAQEDLYNYKDIMNMVKKARIKYPNLKYGMIDPYNSLKMDLSGFSKLSSHDYHYEAISEIKSYGQTTKFGWFINHHCVTEALRKLDSDGYPIAPNKADTEGGGKMANKGDGFGTVHRKVQHPTDWMVTEFHIRKVKDTETGGKHTVINDPLRFEMIKNGCGFRERLDGGNPIDPIREWHKSQGRNLDEQLVPGVIWKPYQDDKDDDLKDFIPF